MKSLWAIFNSREILEEMLSVSEFINQKENAQIKFDYGFI